MSMCNRRNRPQALGFTPQEESVRSDASSSIIIIITLFCTIKSGSAVPFTGVYIHVNLRILIKIMVTVIMIII